MDYSLGRPTYPIAILNILTKLNINQLSIIADIGAGTGLFTNVIAQFGCSIIAVEPNEEMLAQCSRLCDDHLNVTYVHASAEHSTLPSQSVDLITVAQAFHWFDKTLAKHEFKRILRKNGYVLTIWNSLLENDDFTKNYMRLIHQYETKSNAGNSFFDSHLEKLNFFGQDYETVFLNHEQKLNYHALLANATSLSYTPSKLDPIYPEFAEAIMSLYQAYQVSDCVTFYYQSEICICQFAN